MSLSHRAALVWAVVCLVLSVSAHTHAEVEPSPTLKVRPIAGPLQGEQFQSAIVARALSELGYEVEPLTAMPYADAHEAIGAGEGDFFTSHWDPLHDRHFEQAGGSDAMIRHGAFLPESIQGYLIDARTARKYGIKSLDDLRDPQIARLFDTDGDGRANLAGCEPDWGCARVVDRHIDTHGLGAMVQHDQDDYATQIADVIDRVRAGKPALYYAWTPHWSGDALRPGSEVIWLQVPFVTGGDVDKGKLFAEGVETGSGDRNFGFRVSEQRILANRAWSDANPVAARLLEIVTLDPDDIIEQNMRLHRGETSLDRLDDDVDAWIRRHARIYDGWLARARSARK